MSTKALTELAQRWKDLRANDPHLRTRSAAAKLGVSELELVCTGLMSEVTHLSPDHEAILSRFTSLGRVMALTRNDHAVHEVTGRYQELCFEGTTVRAQQQALDLRILLSPLTYIVEVATPWRGGVRRSFQFFDEYGIAIHKVYAVGGTDEQAWRELIENFSHPEPPAAIEPQPFREPLAPELTNPGVDRDAFEKAWRALENARDFSTMLDDFELYPLQAMTLAPPEMVDPVEPAFAIKLLENVRDRQIPIKISVSNRGCLQIFTGPLRTLKRAGGWYNVLDPGFNLHLNDNAIHHAFVVKKPTTDGFVTSLQLFDDRGERIALFEGDTQPGTDEDPRWRECISPKNAPTIC